MEDFQNKQNCMSVTCKNLNLNNGIKKNPDQSSAVTKKDVPATQESQSENSNNIEPQNEAGNPSLVPVYSNTAYASNHVPYNNCPGVHNMNSSIGSGGLTTPHYYSPILNTPQTLLRPLMTTQPPLYSPILPPQQHSYALPHPSPSAGSFSNLPDTFRGTESMSCSEAVFKEGSHQHSRLHSDAANDKSCNMQSSRQFMLDASQKRLNTQSSCSLARFPACAEVVAKTNNFHEQQHAFEEYIRMYGEDGGCRAWVGESGSSNSSGQSTTQHRNNAFASHVHQSGTSVSVHGYSDCRLDSSWNRYVPGPSSSSDTYSADDVSSAANSKHLLKGFSLTSNNCGNSVAVPVSEHNLARAHFEYQAISAGQLASILSYMQPINYQQQSVEERSECRVPGSRSTQESCEMTSSNLQSVETPKKQMTLTTSSHGISTSSNDVAAIANPSENQSSSVTLPTSSDIQLTALSHALPSSNASLGRIQNTQVVETPSAEFSNNASLHPIPPKAVLDLKKGVPSNAGYVTAQTQPPLSCSSVEATASKFQTKSSTTADIQETSKKQGNKEMNSEELTGTAANNFCMLCNASIDEPTSHSLIDTLITVSSKVSVSEKLALMIGCPLPREMLPSMSICPKCFHLINEIDVLEHRLKVCRREVLVAIETVFERNGIHFSPYKRLQRQQYAGSYQHDLQQATYHQHLGTNVMASQNQSTTPGCYQNDTQNYQTLNHIYPIQNNQSHTLHQSHINSIHNNYHQHNVHLPSVTHSQLGHQDHMAQRGAEQHVPSTVFGNHQHQGHVETAHQQMHQHPPVQEEQTKPQHSQQPFNKIHQEAPLKHQQKQTMQHPQEHEQQLITQTTSSNHSLQLHQHQTNQHSHQSVGALGQSNSLPQTSTHNHALQPLSHTTHKHSSTAFSNQPSHVSHSELSLEPAQKHHYQNNSVMLQSHGSICPSHLPTHLCKSEKDNEVALQGQTKFDQLQTNQSKGHESLNQTDDVTVHSISNDIHPSLSQTAIAQLPENLQIKKQKNENHDTSNLLLETNHQIPLILPETSDHLVTHPISVLLSYQHSAETDTVDAESVVSNFDQSYPNEIATTNAEINQSLPLKALQEPIPSIVSSDCDVSAKVQDVNTDTWSQCKSLVDSSNAGPNPSSIAHAECDIDIEKCDNMIDNVCVSNETLTSACAEESRMEDDNSGNGINSQASFRIKKDDEPESIIKEDLTEDVNTSNSVEEPGTSDLNILLPSPSSSTSSPPPRPLGFAEGLRNVQDATEYHKPTLLGKNIKAKKHAKLQICRQCDQVFSNRQALIRHIERRHKNMTSTHFCDTCHRKFNSERTLKQHVLSHKTYPCKICSKMFLNKTKFKKHVIEHTQSLTCKTCNKVMGSPQALISHVKSHDRAQKTYVCSICSRAFTCKRNLDQHSLIHSGEKPFSCDNCGCTFRTRSNMINHYSKCVGKFQFMCATCGRGFVLKSLYERHSAEHEGRFAHKCSICGKGFSKSYDLRHHLTTHTAIPQACSTPCCTICSGHGNSGCNSIKLKDKSTICGICGKRIKRKDTMRDHLSFHDGKRHHTCHLCSMSYFYKANLASHIKIVHLKKFPFTCDLCRKVFSRMGNFNVHMRSHTGDRPYQCKSCGKAFTSNSNYKRHLKCHVTHPLVTDRQREAEDVL